MRKHLHKNWKPYLYSGLFLHAVGCNTLQTKSEAKKLPDVYPAQIMKLPHSVPSNEKPYDRYSNIGKNAKFILNEVHKLYPHDIEYVNDIIKNMLEVYDNAKCDTVYCLPSIDVTLKSTEKAKNRISYNRTPYYRLIIPCLRQLHADISSVIKDKKEFIPAIIKKDINEKLNEVFKQIELLSEIRLVNQQNNILLQIEGTGTIAKTLTSSRKALGRGLSKLRRSGISVRRELKYPQLSSIRSEIKNNVKGVFENSNNLDDQHKKHLVIQQAKDKLEQYNSLVTNTKYALLSIDINNLMKLSQKGRKQQNQEAKVGSDDTDYYARITEALEI